MVIFLKIQKEKLQESKRKGKGEVRIGQINIVTSVGYGN